jgi:hypothetical protein
VSKLGIFPPNVPIQHRRIVMMKKPITINNIKRVELEIIINSTRKKNHSKEDNSSFDMSEDDKIKLLFMGIETQTSTIEDNTRNEGNYEVEGELYLEE